MLVVLLVCLSSLGFSQSSHAMVVEKGIVSRLVDGDTAHVLIKENRKVTRTIKVRFLSIDAPEEHVLASNGKMMGQLPWGKNSTSTLNKILSLGDSVSVETYGLDKYGRTLGEIIYNKENVNLDMVEQGAAIPYIICTDDFCTKSYLFSKNLGKFFHACHTAKAAQVGIFDKRNPLKEMPFEFRARVQKKNFSRYVGNIETKELFEPSDFERVDVCNRVFFENLSHAKKLGFNRVKN